MLILILKLTRSRQRSEDFGLYFIFSSSINVKINETVHSLDFKFINNCLASVVIF